MIRLQSNMVVLQAVNYLCTIASQAVLTGAVLRAVLEPENSRGFYLRIGRQELWLALVSLVFVVLLAMALFARSNSIDLLKLADTVAPAVPFGLLFGRIANFINGELWGRETSLPWGIVFPGAGGAPRHPSQLYEAVLEGLVLFLVLRFATHQRLWLQRRGVVAGLFLLGYGLFRLALENVREPDSFLTDLVEATGGLTMGMLLSLPMMLGGAWLVWRGLSQPVATAGAGSEGEAPRTGSGS
jgi:phosphatidylglycerol:prolipoprotein diacylglycerol transferase